MVSVSIGFLLKSTTFTPNPTTLGLFSSCALALLTVPNVNKAITASFNNFIIKFLN